MLNQSLYRETGYESRRTLLKLYQLWENLATQQDNDDVDDDTNNNDDDHHNRRMVEGWHSKHCTE